MGRKTKLTPETVAILVRFLSDGNTDRDACAAAGISTSIFYEWLTRGEAAKTGTYFDFLDAVTRARAGARQRAVEAIKSAVVGGQTVEEYTELFTETRPAKDGGTYKVEMQKTTRKVIKHPPDFRAAVEYLKRRDPEHWSEKINHDTHISIESAVDNAAAEFERLINSIAAGDGTGAVAE